MVIRVLRLVLGRTTPGMAGRQPEALLRRECQFGSISCVGIMDCVAHGDFLVILGRLYVIDI